MSNHPEHDHPEHDQPGLEERIRQKAHEIWEGEGRPEGLEVEHWYKAQDFINRETFEATVGTPNAAAEAADFSPESDNVAPFVRGAGGAKAPRHASALRSRQATGSEGTRPARVVVR
jgi:hypothetical protein